MRIVSETVALRDSVIPVAMAAGFFDGVHAGHRLILSQAVLQAEHSGGEAWVLTFDRHPFAVLAPSKSPPLLSTLDERLSLFESLGIKNVLLLPFTREMAVMEPEDFISELSGGPVSALSAPLNTILCGPDWRFGRRAQGTPELLKALGPRYGFQVKVIPFALYQGERVSSTRIREALQAGQIDDATAMLMRPYGVDGVIVKGRGVAGNALGFPTANIKTEAEVLPMNGVYAVDAILEGEFPRRGVANLGLCPTFSDAPPVPTLEVHILNEDRSLYGRKIRILFKKRLRGEERFPSVEVLKTQIQCDVAEALKA